MTAALPTRLCIRSTWPARPPNAGPAAGVAVRCCAGSTTSPCSRAPSATRRSITRVRRRERAGSATLRARRAPPRARGSARRAPRSSRTRRTTRRPARAARPRPAAPRRLPPRRPPPASRTRRRGCRSGRGAAHARAGRADQVRGDDGRRPARARAARSRRPCREPPRIRCTPPCGNAVSAFSVASTFVALESFHQATPSISATRSSRWATGWNARTARADRLVVDPERAAPGRRPPRRSRGCARRPAAPRRSPRRPRRRRAPRIAPRRRRAARRARRPRGRRRSAPPCRRAAGARRCAASASRRRPSCRGGRGGRA